MPSNQVVIATEPILRGIMEKEIDSLLEKEKLIVLVNSGKEFEPYISNEEDFAFGMIIGIITEVLICRTLDRYNRRPTREEWKELRDILRRRTPEIKSKISEALMMRP